MDQAVKKALQKVKRNVNTLQKVANGIFKVKNSAQLVMVTMVDFATKECSATYTDGDGEPETVPLVEYVRYI